MKSSNLGHKLVFGIVGAIYTVIGGAMLALVIADAGGVERLSAYSEEADSFPVLLGMVFLALGIAFLLVMLLLNRADKRRAQLREELLAWGSRAKGEVVEVRIDHSIRINRRSPVIARVRCQLRGNEVTLKSPRLWNVQPAVGDAAEVLYDPMDETRYVIEFGKK